jgi:hypothetical protein
MVRQQLAAILASGTFAKARRQKAFLAYITGMTLEGRQEEVSEYSIAQLYDRPAAFSAYCNESKNPSGQNIMLARGDDGKSFVIQCIVDSRWSKCAPLPEGETFEARKDKHGITVLYRTAKGKETKQLYLLVAAGAAPLPEAPSWKSPAPAPGVPAGSGPEATAEKVKCNFSSTPNGAEIVVDGRYLGNTPSVIGLGAGTHLVVLSLPGFAPWKRDLTVAAGSDVNVTASLRKPRP